MKLDFPHRFVTRCTAASRTAEGELRCIVGKSQRATVWLEPYPSLSEQNLQRKDSTAWLQQEGWVGGFAMSWAGYITSECGLWRTSCNKSHVSSPAKRCAHVQENRSARLKLYICSLKRKPEVFICKQNFLSRNKNVLKLYFVNTMQLLNVRIFFENG